MSNSMNWAEMDTDEVVRHIDEAKEEIQHRNLTYLLGDPDGSDASMPENPLKNPLGLDVGRLYLSDPCVPTTRMLALDEARKIANEVALLAEGNPVMGFRIQGATEHSFNGRMLVHLNHEMNAIYCLVSMEIKRGCERDGYYADSIPSDHSIRLMQDAWRRAEGFISFLGKGKERKAVWFAERHRHLLVGLALGGRRAAHWHGG